MDNHIIAPSTKPSIQPASDQIFICQKFLHGHPASLPASVQAKNEEAFRQAMADIPEDDKQVLHSIAKRIISLAAECHPISDKKKTCDVKVCLSLASVRSADPWDTYLRPIKWYMNLHREELSLHGHTVGNVRCANNNSGCGWVVTFD